MEQKPKLLVVCGPTAVGKTAFAIDLALGAGAEIIGADSMQIYRRMDIGTAKPTPEERARVPHHLIDFVAPDEPFDAAAYAARARKCADRLIENGTVPMVVGGTGLYIKGFLGGLFRAPSSDPPLRERLKEEAERVGSPALHERLSAVDPDTAARLHPNDTYRIVRALEVFEVSGRPISRQQRRHRFADAPYRALKIGLFMERESLYRRIDRRCALMLETGLIEEVKDLLERGYGPELKPMQSIGYRHAVDYLQGRTSLEETRRLFARDTRRYAKRQLTWFRADPQVRWLEPQEIEKARNEVRRFLEEPPAGPDTPL